MALALNDDLTTGPMLTHYKNLAIPAALGMLFSTLYNIVDVYYAGKLSTEAQAGLAIGYQAFFIMMAVGFGLGSALSALVSNAKGEKNTTASRSLAAQGLSFGVIATALLMVGGWFAGPHLIALVSEPGGYRDAALGYFRLLILALPGFLLAYGGNGILQAHGDTRSMQRAMMVAFFANIGLNPLMMFGIPGIWGGMGFNGIALATVISQTGVMAFILSRVFNLNMMERVKRAEFMPDPTCYKAIVEQMLPATTALVVMFVSGFVVQFALKNFGEDAIAAYGVALRIEQILLLPVLGMTSALLPIAGQNFGAKEYDRVRDAVFFCWKLGFALSLVAMPALWFGGAWAMRPFTSDPDVIEIGASYLLVDGFLFPIYMMLFSINSLLQAMKRPIYTLWISVYRQGFGVAFFIWVFIALLGFDVWGVWLGIATAVSTGWVMALIVAIRVSQTTMGGLRAKPA
ncbi:MULTISPECIES: MATE family efflux transporter [Marivita]|nr:MULTISPECIES: MATE family efflux transporter [Marivita]MCR9170780.1 MATE family efflux transporter [Paracoccaceae bacterium]OSQ62015.1 multidrug transporter MATE [Marivita cryptomonadis]